MNKITTVIMGLWIGLAGAASTQAGPVVVELFTSQGCSSCPPADEFLGKLAKRDDVIALSLHVDYWDYIGWKDTFASPQFTQRQHAYARAVSQRMVYTPQMVIGGVDHVVGTKRGAVAKLIKIHSKAEDPVYLNITRNGDQVTILAKPRKAGLGRMVVQMVRYKLGQVTQIKRGENAGRDLAYHNIVTEWVVLKEWNGVSPISLTANILGDEACAIIVQSAANGPVLAAAKLP